MDISGWIDAAREAQPHQEGRGATNVGEAASPGLYVGACRLHVPRVSRATPSSCDGCDIVEVIACRAVRSPPRGHAQSAWHSSSREVV